MTSRPTTPHSPGEIRLNEMNRLADMAHFPVLVNAGATVNVLLTICITWKFIEPRYTPFAALWLALVLAVNLLPVILLRLTLTPATIYPRLREMHFIHDQHKFSDWVYVAASANMAFWILLTWTLAELDHHLPILIVLLSIAAIATFSPVLLRSVRTDG